MRARAALATERNDTNLQAYVNACEPQLKQLVEAYADGQSLGSATFGSVMNEADMLFPATLTAASMAARLVVLLDEAKGEGACAGRVHVVVDITSPSPSARALLEADVRMTRGV